MNLHRTNRIIWYVHKQLTMPNCYQRLDAPIFSGMKISTFIDGLPLLVVYIPKVDLYVTFTRKHKVRFCYIIFNLGLKDSGYTMKNRHVLVTYFHTFCK